ncbi:MAG: DUF4838 domain-containing protein [Armatimonadota bacterium]
MLLASDKHACFTIIIAHDAPPAVRYAAEELQRYVDLMAVAHAPIRTDEQSVERRMILVGDSALRGKLFPEVKGESLQFEDYLIRTNDHLLILGGSPRAVLYGVYDLLERLGVRWWAPGEETVPVRLLLDIEPINIDVRPPLIYRATWYRNAMNADWQARVRLDAGTMGPVLLQERHGGMERFANDHTGHTYDGLVPTAKYFDPHPEYYSEVNGVRLRHTNQLCCTHPDVADIAAETARQWLDRTPGSRIVSVTQNDHGNWCTCMECTKMMEHEGGPTAPALHLANEVAKRLEKTHPYALVDTFAYAYTQAPPKHLQAHPQVLVRLAPIGNCFGHSIQSCPVNQPCLEAVQGWSKIARNLFVWHYVADFFHYLAPFPNLPPLQEDIRFYVEHGVKGIFMQGDGNSPGGDFAELKAWLIARLLWNPKLEAADARWEFLRGYYREAAPAVQEYLETFEQVFAASGQHLHLYRTLWQNEAAYFEPPVLKRARAALNRAKRQADGPDVLSRLQRIEAGLDYTELFYHEHPKRRVRRDGNLACRVSPRREEMVNRFFTAVDAHRITHYAEEYGRYTKTTELRRVWQDSTGTHKVLTLEHGNSRAEIAPTLGGRILTFGSKSVNHLGQSTPGTFGYPCAGGYEEYTTPSHQSAGFASAFQVLKRSKTQATLQATVDSGLVLHRTIALGQDDTLTVRTELRNPLDLPVPGCLRAHLEIDLGTPVTELQYWFLLDGEWVPREAGKHGPAGSWYEGDVPEGWAFWAEGTQRGLWQRWERGQVGAIYLGGIPGESNTLALDLAANRSGAAIPPGKCQLIKHLFGWVKNNTFCDKIVQSK